MACFELCEVLGEYRMESAMRPAEQPRLRSLVEVVLRPCLDASETGTRRAQGQRLPLPNKFSNSSLALDQ